MDQATTDFAEFYEQSRAGCLRAVYVRPDTSSGSVTLVIDPAAMPAGSVLRLAGAAYPGAELEIRGSDGTMEDEQMIGVGVGLFSGAPGPEQCGSDQVVHVVTGPGTSAGPAGS